MGSPCNEFLVFQPALKDVVEHAVEERDISARLHLQMDVRASGELCPTRIGDDELCATNVGSLQCGAEHGMTLRGICTSDKNDVTGFLNFPHRS